ncbi:hypothetical protein CDO35_10845 [Pseudomonas sediminis]|uniref:Uncharacterized protein n=1 Tax=Pseudomonas sediminis TaxID=1691904 RepID=A0A2G5FLI9_9PSED|nr:hypothetical protein CDO35_10845 [Pseudomonas sediminis]
MFAEQRLAIACRFSWVLNRAVINSQQVRVFAGQAIAGLLALHVGAAAFVEFYSRGAPVQLRLFKVATAG